MGETLRTEDDGGVRSIVLTRAAEYNTITPQLRDELGAAIDEADADNAIRVILLRAEGPAFCAGYGLDWSTAAQAQSETASARRVWDSVADYRMISRFVDT
ncbi:MAG: enoyl-CoA hydratase, partial [Actinomycetota bacterium]|nr:enoyl-CoA hydratase [Actinomycetota bacterium]